MVYGHLAYHYFGKIPRSTLWKKEDHPQNMKHQLTPLFFAKGFQAIVFFAEKLQP